VSSLAAKYANLDPLEIPWVGSAERDQFAADVRTMAASLLRQDEHRGVRRLLRKVVGK
jgi:hypothetical protein